MQSPAKRGHAHAWAPIPENLPRYLTSFIGRERELAGLGKLLAGSRLVTVTGTGGAGKSRLAAQVVRTRVDRWRDGVWWVDLAPVSDHRQVASAVVTALNLPGSGQAFDVTTAWLATKLALLILDNCEHLVDGCAEFCDNILKLCPSLTILATSREPLEVPGEARWPISPLQTPEAVLLFEARARLVAPNFKVESSNVGPVTEICERLDDLPLAIELAATRLDVMNELELLSQLDHGFNVLKAGARTAPDRQKTMLATIDWSYRLLDDDEARLFRRLSVFRGGFTLESNQGVCVDDARAGVLDVLAGLVRKSMVVAEKSKDATSRYRLLESHLTYAEEQLRQGGELEDMRRRHYEYFLASITTRTRTWTGPTAGTVTGAAEETWKRQELGNLWAALRWARTNAEDLGLTLATNVGRIGSVDVTQIRSWLSDLLDRSPSQGRPRMIATRIAMHLAWRQGDYEASLSMAEISLGIARTVGDNVELAASLHRLGDAHLNLRDFKAATSAYDEALNVVEGSGNTRLKADLQGSLGYAALVEGRYRFARELLTAAAAAMRSAGDTFSTGRLLESRANAELGCGDHEIADMTWREALSISLQLGDHYDAIWCLGGLSRTATARGDHGRAVRLAAARSRLALEWSSGDDADFAVHRGVAQEKSRAALGPKRNDEAWKEGLTLSLERAADYALGKQDAATADAGPLSRREIEVAKLVAGGMTNREVGERLFISDRTAEGHLEKIRNKLGVRSRTEVAAWVAEQGLMEKKEGAQARAPFKQVRARTRTTGDSH